MMVLNPWSIATPMQYFSPSSNLVQVHRQRGRGGSDRAGQACTWAVLQTAGMHWGSAAAALLAAVRVCGPCGCRVPSLKPEAALAGLAGASHVCWGCCRLGVWAVRVAAPPRCRQSLTP